MTFAERLRRAADKIGSQAKLAAFLGVKRQAVQRWIAGQPPLESTMRRLDPMLTQIEGN